MFFYDFHGFGSIRSTQPTGLFRHISIAARKLQSKSVGFHSGSGECGVSGDSCVFFMIFTVLVASVQPNLQDY